jgi:hypothetical protein
MTLLGRRRYVPLYATQMHFALGGEGACKPKWTKPAQDAVIAQFWADAPALLPLLGVKPHWMQLSEIEWMIHRGCSDDGGWGVPLACHPLAEHMIFATPESMTNQHPRYGHQRFTSGRPASNNTVTIPYLGHVHRASMQHQAKLLADERVASKKEYVASVCFGSMRGAQLRVNLTLQCDDRADECLNVRGGSLLDIIDSYRRAWFCVQPYGDSPTRSALLDCIASGLAVPCVFDEFLFDMLPFADVIDYREMVAYVPADAIMAPGASFLDWLRHYDAAARAAMLGSLQAVSQALQYAVQPNHLLVRHDRLAVVDPLDDAFTMSLKAVLRHACKLSHRQCRQPRAGHGARHKARGGEEAAGRQRLVRLR